MTKKIYFVEGNIGCGKTTILDGLDKYINENKIENIKIVYEPVKKWQEIGLLDNFYKDTSRWSYTFQNFAFITKMMEIDNFKDDMIYIVERSPMTDRNCFAELCYENGFMTKMEWEIYNYWYNHYISKKDYNGFIYLLADPDICYNRIKKRNRNEEADISKDYLKKLDDKHKKWLLESNDNNKKEILYLEDDFNLDTIDTAISKILNFIKKDSVQKVGKGRRIRKTRDCFLKERKSCFF